MNLATGRKEKGIFYGWWIVLVAAIGMFMGYGAIYNYTYGVFTNSIGREFEWSRSTISLAYSLSLIAYSVATPMIGRWIDRVGARKIIVPSLILFALGMMGFYFLSSSLWIFFGLNIALGLLGGGSAIVPYSQVISHWFDRRRGLALGLAMIGVGLSSFIMPSLVHAWISEVGWRLAYVYVGLLALVVAIPVAFFLKEKPQMMGLQPDGEASGAAIDRARLQTGLRGGEALRSGTFWLLFSGVFLVATAIIGCLIHLVLMLTDRGLTAQEAAFAASLLGGAVIPGRVLSGYLVDRFFAPTIAIYFFGAAGLGVFVLWSGAAGSWVFVAAFLLGLGMGAEGELIAILVSRYFGLIAFSEIYGYALISFALGGIVGPPLMGLVFDQTGSYRWILGGFLFAILGGVALIRQLGPYPDWGTKKASGPVPDVLPERA